MGGRLLPVERLTKVKGQNGFRNIQVCFIVSVNSNCINAYLASFTLATQSAVKEWVTNMQKDYDVKGI